MAKLTTTFNGPPSLSIAQDDATRQRQYIAVREWLDAGADPNSTSPGGSVFFVDAAWSGNVAVVALLLDHGADVNARTKSGITPLTAAALEGHSDVVALLLERGANALPRTRNGWDAETCAYINGNRQLGRDIAAAAAVQRNTTLQDDITVSRPLRLKPPS
jgi:ankyrin repeat protein